MTRCCVFLLVAMIAVGCASHGTNPKDGELTQRQQAAAINAQLGTDYFRQGNWEEAKIKLERALDQDSHNSQAHMMAGMLYMQLGERDKAESHLQRAVSLDEKNPDTRNALAVFLCKYGKYEAGEKQALTAAADPLYKTPEQALLNAGYCARNAGKPELAEKHFRQALAVQPRFPQALLELADLEYRGNQFMIARAFLERYHAVVPVSAGSLLLGARIETGLNNRSMAADYARRLRNEFPTSDEAKALAEFERTGR